MSVTGEGVHPFAPRRILVAGPGLLLCAAVALPAWELSHLHPSLDALALSLILGMILGNVLGPAARLQPGVSLASIIFVPLGIILYGSRLDFGVFASLPLYTAAIVVAIVVAFYLVIMTGSRLLGVDFRTGLLIASGSAICGASAIAVLSPVVGARSRDISMALIVTTTAGLSGALLYPIIADAFSMSDTAYGLFCGSTLQQTGIVKLAASHLGDPARDIAVPVKMMRIAMLAPVTVLLAATVQLRRPVGRSGPVPSRRGLYSRALLRCWFIPVFLAVAVLFTFWDPATRLHHSIESAATVFLAMGLASIGLTVNFDSILSSGSRPLLLGFAGWATVGLIVLALLLAILSGTR